MLNRASRWRARRQMRYPACCACHRRIERHSSICQARFGHACNCREHCTYGGAIRQVRSMVGVESAERCHRDGSGSNPNCSHPCSRTPFALRTTPSFAALFSLRFRYDPPAPVHSCQPPPSALDSCTIESASFPLCVSSTTLIFAVM